MLIDSARRAWRRSVPEPTRRRIRRLVTDLPHRLRDAVPDLLERLASARPLPPARLRARVGLTSSRREFREVGGTAARCVLAALAESGSEVVDSPRWLDFGCGSGRVARHLSTQPIRLVGVDVDGEAVAWCGRNLPGEYTAIGPRPPIPMPDASADVVCAVSVFTHMDETAQRDWLREIHRLLRSGGAFVVTTLSPELTWTRPDLTSDQHAALASRGFLFAAASGPFNDSSAFQTERYLRESWSDLFAPRLFQRGGLGGYQDLSVWERRAAVSGPLDSPAGAPRAAGG
jgi:SAM-dependent methyltransferase